MVSFTSILRTKKPQHLSATWVIHNNSLQFGVNVRGRCKINYYYFVILTFLPRNFVSLPLVLFIYFNLMFKIWSHVEAVTFPRNSSHTFWIVFFPVGLFLQEICFSALEMTTKVHKNSNKNDIRKMNVFYLSFNECRIVKYKRSRHTNRKCLEKEKLRNFAYDSFITTIVGSFIHTHAEHVRTAFNNLCPTRCTQFTAYSSGLWFKFSGDSINFKLVKLDIMKN